MPNKKQKFIKKASKSKTNSGLKANKSEKLQSDHQLSSRSVKVSQGELLEQTDAHRELADDHVISTTRGANLEAHVAGLRQRLTTLCDAHPHLAGQLRQHQSQFRIQLPAAMPSSLLLRALGKNRTKYDHLSEERVAVLPDDPTQITLRLDGLKQEQLTIFIKELEEVISEFTGRS